MHDRQPQIPYPILRVGWTASCNRKMTGPFWSFRDHGSMLALPVVLAIAWYEGGGRLHGIWC